MNAFKLIIAGAAALALSTAAHADPVASSQWASTNSNGGLGGTFAYLNSNGVNPLSLPDAWTLGHADGNVVFDADFGGSLYSNAGAWDGTSYILPFGAPDTTSYGQTFFAPSASLTSFNFLVYNTSAPGQNQAKLVVSAFNGSRAVGPALYIADVTVPVGTDYAWTNFGNLNVSLNQGDQYIAFLTVADVQSGGGVVPEPGAWALMILGFGAVGGALRSRRSLASVA